MVSRRTFLGGALATAATRAAVTDAPPGVSLDLTHPPADLAGLFRRVAAGGHRDVEIAGLRDRRPSEIRKLLDDAGLSCKTICWEMWLNDADSQDTIDAAVELEVDYLLTAGPSLMGKEWFEPDRDPAGRMTLNDWRWNADWFNHVGGLAQKNNVQFVYRTQAYDPQGFDELYRRTEPTRVKFELDCTTTPEPGAFLKRYASRTVLLRVAGAQECARFRPDAPEVRHCYVKA